MRLFPEQSLKGISFSTLRVLALTYALFGVLLYLRQDAYLFYPPTTPMEECADLPDAKVISADGTRAYYIESASSTKLGVIYHGNAERAYDSAYLVNWLTHYGYNVLAVEYSGYASDDSQKPSVKLLLRDTEHIDAWVKEKNFSELLIIGRSIGVGFASYHTSLSSPERLVLISPFDTLSGLAKTHYPVYPISLLLRTELDNVTNAAFAKEVLLIHGADDSEIPIERGRVLFEKLPQKQKTFVTVEGFGHNDVLGTEESWSALTAFLQ